MTKDERNKILAQGKTILRPQWNARTNRWVISKLTAAGGWKRFGGRWYLTANEAEKTIDMVIGTTDGQYVKEIFHDNSR